MLWVMVIRTLLCMPLFATLIACDASPNSAATSSVPSPVSITPDTNATSAPNARTSPDPTPMPLFADPQAIGADARVGVISGGILDGWRYDGRAGTLTKDRSVPRSTLSPSGRWTLEARNVMNGAIIERADLWLIDAATGAARLLYSPPELPPQQAGQNVQPNSLIPPYVFQRTSNRSSPPAPCAMRW